MNNHSLPKLLITEQISLLTPTTPTKEEISNKLISVNYHLIKACNYRCRFCFAHFNQVKSNYLSLGESMKIIELLVEQGTKKITFVGGEPTLVPFLPELVIFSKSLGLTTMIVTNGSKLNEDYIKKFDGALDWIGLSIDSSIEDISEELGRGMGKHVNQTRQNSKLLKKFGIKIKLNSVITSLNWKEDMNWLIEEVNPLRWKVFKILIIEGENDNAIDLTITDDQFFQFLNIHKRNNPIAEDNDAMTDSYVMIDPQGRFYNNTLGRLNHGKSILEVGVQEAFNSTNFSLEKFKQRGGEYQWEE
ncbi:MAG: viperin family antiviral radical SAM protein [Candidatus Heimdallarchaeota archaeon]|nr:viperin family antiviral radical SAM protein [Candidatus Heimdallarchaeota archaeon]